MNKLISLLIVTIGSISYAQNCCQPVTCEAVRPTCMTKPKTRVVVKRVVVEKIVEKPVEKVVERLVEKPVPVFVDKVRVEKYVEKRKKNRISLVGGSGPTALKTVSYEDRIVRGPIGGLQYQRMLDSNFSVGIVGLTNQTVLGSVGFDF